MIRLTLPWLVFTALFIFLAGIIIAWIGYALLRRHSEKQKLLAWTRCHVCAFPYKPPIPTGPTRCPQCHSLNEHRALGNI